MADVFIDSVFRVFGFFVQLRLFKQLKVTTADIFRKSLFCVAEEFDQYPCVNEPCKMDRFANMDVVLVVFGYAVTRSFAIARSQVFLRELSLKGVL